MDLKSSAIPLAMLSMFLLLNQFEQHAKIDSLSRALQESQIKLDRGDQMIEKLRGFN